MIEVQAELCSIRYCPLTDDPLISRRNPFVDPFISCRNPLTDEADKNGFDVAKGGCAVTQGLCPRMGRITPFEGLPKKRKNC